MGMKNTQNSIFGANIVGAFGKFALIYFAAGVFFVLLTLIAGTYFGPEPCCDCSYDEQNVLGCDSK
jgi:hypothetical protein